MARVENAALALGNEAPLLATCLSVVCADLPGYGRSGCPQIGDSLTKGKKLLGGGKRHWT